MKKRLIDANVLRNHWIQAGEDKYIYNAKAVINTIDVQPTIDAAPVVHGKWIEKRGQTYLPVEYNEEGELILHDYTTYICSICGRHEAVKEPYCNCGAKMGSKKEANIEPRCSTCACDKVCDHNRYGFENCGNYIPREVGDDA